MTILKTAVIIYSVQSVTHTRRYYVLKGMKIKMENCTKNRILEEALVCFANNGYKGTNLRDLAAQTGITKSALYRHFESKEDIWNAVLDMMEFYYSERFGSPDKVPDVPDSCDGLVEMTVKMLDFTMHDKKVVLTRRLLLTEQFHDERAKKLTEFHFLNGIKEIYAKIFAGMMDKGILKRDDPEMLAFEYTAPISALVQEHDREPGKETEIMAQIRDFVDHFIKVFAEK